MTREEAALSEIEAQEPAQFVRLYLAADDASYTLDRLGACEAARKLRDGLAEAKGCNPEGIGLERGCCDPEAGELCPDCAERASWREEP